MTYYLLNDPASQRQRLVRDDHISSVEINKTDQVITLVLIGGQEIRLTHEESKQFMHHIKSHMPASATK
ncbi:MAG: hypothetical protein ACJ8FY_12445 [Gemmataceae bacterium]